MNTMNNIPENVTSNAAKIDFPAGSYFVTMTTDMLFQMGRLTEDIGLENSDYDAETNAWSGTVELIDGAKISTSEYFEYVELINGLNQFIGDNNGHQYGIGILRKDELPESEIDFLLRYNLIIPLTLTEPIVLIDVENLPEDETAELDIDDEITYALLHADGSITDAQTLLNQNS